MPQKLVDIAVIGCGVGGASAASAAARNGCSVTILEEHSRVGEPSHCSGHVGILAFKQLAPTIPSKIIENEIKGVILHPPNEKPLTLTSEEPVTWVINRTDFDRHLATVAAEDGADLRVNCRVQNLERTSGGNFSLKLAQNAQEINCKLVIDASGCSSSISKAMALPQPDRKMTVNSAQLVMDNLTDLNEQFVEMYFGQGFAPGFFGWIIPKDDGTAKLGIAAAAPANVHQCLQKFIRKHPIASAKLRKAKPKTKINYHPIPLGGAISRTYKNGILAVGDAASQVKPTTGGGIIFALACGRIAGKIAARAVRDGDTSEKALRQYQESWQQAIGFDLKTMLLLRRVLFKLPDRKLDRIFRIAKALKVDEVLRTTKDIDFQGKTLLSLAHNPRLFITLLSGSILSAPSLIMSAEAGR